MVVGRGKFSSRFGFIMAASGSAVGLGNIWGFPTQTASNGGAAFVLVYLILAFCLAYPVLMAELVIGRFANANSVSAYQAISKNGLSRKIGSAIGLYGIIVVGLILSFYAIVAGWMIAFGLDPLVKMLGLEQASQWLTEFSTSRNIIFCIMFMLLTIHIVSNGVKQGIEKWSTRLMPMLLILLFSLIIYVLSQDGGLQGLKAYLVPDCKYFNHTE